MPSKKNPKWKRFETLVAKLQQAFSPDAAVTLNDKIQGKHSGVMRQIDISVRKTVGQFSILIVLDCKDYSHPADVKDIEEFIGLVEDVGANKGALVAAKGFTEAARTRAQNSGIDLYRLVDAEARDWKAYVSIPVVCDFRSLGTGQFKIGGSLSVLQELNLQDPQLIQLFNKDYLDIGTPLSLLWAKWNRGEIPTEPGLYEDLKISSEPVFVRSRDGHYEEIGILASFNVIQNLYYGQLPLTRITGFKDEITGNLMLPGNTEIVTAFINPLEAERSWPKIPSLEALAVKPTIILTALDHYPSMIPSGSQGKE